MSDKTDKSDTKWQPGMVNALEARLCSLLAANIAAFGQICVDNETLMDVKYGSGAYGTTSYEETLRLICEDYNWMFMENDCLNEWTIMPLKTY